MAAHVPTDQTVASAGLGISGTEARERALAAPPAAPDLTDLAWCAARWDTLSLGERIRALRCAEALREDLGIARSVRGGRP